MRIKGVLFDIDGTLVDSNDAHVRAWQEAFAAAGYSFDAPTIHNEIGKGTDMLVPALVPDARDELVEQLGSAHGAIFKARYLNWVQPFSGARELLLRTHAAGKKVVLASSASQEELDYYVTLLDIRSILAATTTSADVQSTKPAPDIFGVALKKIAPLDASDVLVVGDAPYDVESARKCEIDTVALRSGGFTDVALQDALAIYDSAGALLADFDASPLAS